MIAIASDGPAWNWLRVGGWSGSFAVHALVLLLVAAPAIAPIARPAPEPVIARWIESEPAPPPLPEPPPPATPHRTRPTPVHALPSPPTPVSIPAPTTPLETAATTAADAISTPATPQTADISSAGATQTLAYATPLQPPYPAASLRAHEQGTVLLRVLVDPTGVPQRVEIARSSGHARLDTAARDSVLRARFRPVMRDGAAIAAWGLVPIAFRLDRG